MALTKNQRKWVRALRSGKYKQARKVLCDPQKESYCCLGVACELAIADGVSLTKKQLKNICYYGGESKFLPSRVVEWLDIADTFGVFGEFDNQSLAIKNDDGYSLNEIADLIVKHQDRLFTKHA